MDILKNTPITLLNQQITVQQLQRYKIDIEAWRNALNAAENVNMPIRKRLYEIYNEIMLDAFLYAIVDKRIRQVKNIPLVFIGKDDKPDYTITAMFQTQWMLQIIHYILESIFWGHSLIEFQMKNGKIQDVCLIPRQHVNPQTGIVSLTSPYDKDGIQFRNGQYPKYTLEINTKSLGLLNIAAANTIYKKYGKIDFSNFVEMFGAPIRHYEYDPNIHNAKAEVEEAAKKSGNSSAIITPKDYANLKILDTNQVNSDVHNRFLQEIKDELSILILGQTMTTQNGSSRSQAEVHLQQQQEIKQEDKRFVEYILNHQLKDKLEALGYPVTNGYFMFDDTENLPIDKQLEMDLKIAQLYNVPASYFTEKYGVPIVELKKQNQKLEVQKKKSKPNPDTKHNQKLSQNQNAIFSPNEGLITPDKSVLNIVKRLVKRTLNNFSTFHHSFSKKSSRLPDSGTVQTWLADLQTNGYSAPLFNYYADTFLQAFALDYTPDEIDFNTTQGENYLKLRLSILRFALAKQFALLKDAQKNAESLDVIFKQHQLFLEVEKEHFIAVGQMTQKWYDIQKSPKPYIQYITAADEHVRPSHQKLNNIALPKQHPFWQTHFPPLGWRCRCSVKTLSEAQYQALPAGSKTAPTVAPDATEFYNNPAITGNAIGQQHRYLRTMTDAQKQQANTFERIKTAQKAIDNQKEYAQATADFIRIYFNVENGGYLMQHKNAHKKDLKRNLIAGKTLALNGNSVVIREHIEGDKNPEFWVNGKLSDLKTPDTEKYDTIIKALKGAFKSAYKQKITELVVEITNPKETLDDIMKGIRNGFKYYEAIQKVFVIRGNKTAEISREVFEKGKILYVLQENL